MRGMRWLAIALMLITYLIARGEIGSLGFGEDWLIGWAVCTVLMFFIIMIHEGGHAVAALRVGATVRSIMVFPFQLDLQAGKLGMAQGHRRGDVGGYVAYRLDRADAGRGHMIVAAAGPLSNLTTAALAILCTGGSGALPPIAGAFATLSIGVGISNLLPFEGSDGHRLVTGLRRKAPGADT